MDSAGVDAASVLAANEAAAGVAASGGAAAGVAAATMAASCWLRGVRGQLAALQHSLLSSAASPRSCGRTCVSWDRSSGRGGSGGSGGGGGSCPCSSTEWFRSRRGGSTRSSSCPCRPESTSYKCSAELSRHQQLQHRATSLNLITRHNKECSVTPFLPETILSLFYLVVLLRSDCSCILRGVPGAACDHVSLGFLDVQLDQVLILSAGDGPECLEVNLLVFLSWTETLLACWWWQMAGCDRTANNDGLDVGRKLEA